MTELYDLNTYQAIAPALILAGTAMVLFLLDSISPDDTNDTLLSWTALAGALGTLAVAGWYLTAGVGTPASEGGRGVFSLFADTLVVDQMALFFTVVVASVTALVVVASHDYLEGHAHRGEFYSLVLLAATGMATMAMANSLVTVFIAMELSSLPSYALVAFLKDNRGSVEAGMKYFLIGALSSAILVYGISLVFVETGSLQLGAVAEAVAEVENVGVLGIGVLMVVAGIAFKTASAPFHFWAPEAYEGAPAPVSAFLSSASKAAGFVIAFRVFAEAFPIELIVDGQVGLDWILAFQILAVVTMIVGNFAAAVQDKVKRMLAYSSVGHAGYALIGLAALSNAGPYNDLVTGAAMMHLLVYGFMNTGAFLFIALAEYWGVGRRFEDFNGLATQAPVACAAMTVFLFNLAGLPIGAGFLSKYFLFGAAVGNGYWWLAAVGALASALSLYYYAKLAKAMWIEEPARELSIDSQPVGLYTAVVAAAVVTIALLIAFSPVAETAIEAAGQIVV